MSPEQKQKLRPSCGRYLVAHPDRWPPHWSDHLFPEQSCSMPGHTEPHHIMRTTLSLVEEAPVANASPGRGRRPDAGSSSSESRLQAAGLGPERQEVVGDSGGQGEGQEGGSGRPAGRQEQQAGAAAGSGWLISRLLP